MCACIDLRCTADEVSLLQLTYVTRRRAGSDGRTDGLFDLRGHEALELARLHFIHDVTRLERWTDEQPSTNGFALLLTNDARLWEAPPTTNTGDAAFRLHEGRTLTGELAWGDDEHPYEADRRTLRGTYRTTWSDFSRPDAGVGGTLRWLGWTITSRAPGAV